MKNNKTPSFMVMMDLHIKERKIELIFDIVKQVITRCEKLGITTVIQGGDIFDSRRSQSLPILLAVKKILSLFNQSGIDLYVIAGNHDRVNLDSEDSYLTVFEDLRNVHILNKERILKNEHNLDIHLLPYFDENGSYVSRLKSLTDRIADKKSILITHIGINGALNNNEEEVNNQVSPELFNKYHKVLIGHYHNRSIVNEKIEYSGSCYQANFGEDDQKGCTIIYDDGSTEFVQLKFPKFITVEQDIKVSQEDFTSLVENVKNSKNNIRVKILSDGVADHRLRKSILEEIGASVYIDKKDVLINPSEAIAIYKPITSGELEKEFEVWVDEKTPNDIEFGRKVLFNK